MITATTDALSPLGELIVIWLLTQKEERGTKSELERALKAILEIRWSAAAERRRALDEDLLALERAGHIERGKRGGIVLAKRGRRAGLAALGLEALPPKATWRTVKKRYLFTRALGYSPPTTPAAVRRFDMPGGIRAVILAHQYELDVDEYPTINQVADALVWHLLGVKTRERLTVSAIKKLVLNRELGGQRSLEPGKALEHLAARAIKARSTGLDVLQDTGLFRWLDTPGPSPSGEAPQVKAPEQSISQTIAPPDNEIAFASRVMEAAKASKTGRFGKNKVFISHVFRKLAEEGAVAEDADAFKARLVDAHLRGLLSLSRADLVEAMSPEDVVASEAQKGGSTFHFVRLQG
jgi:hypothetical protein